MTSGQLLLVGSGIAAALVAHRMPKFRKPALITAMGLISIGVLADAPTTTLPPATSSSNATVLGNESAAVRSDFFDRGAYGRNGNVPDDATYQANMARLTDLANRIRNARAALPSTSPDVSGLDSALKSVQEVQGGALTYKVRQVLDDPKRGAADKSFVQELLQQAQTLPSTNAGNPKALVEPIRQMLAAIGT